MTVVYQDAPNHYVVKIGLVFLCSFQSITPLSMTSMYQVQLPLMKSLLIAYLEINGYADIIHMKPTTLYYLPLLISSMVAHC